MPNENGFTATWIHAALNAGGSLRVWCVFPGKRIFRAEMTWPGESPITSEISMSVESVLLDLNNRLQEDAAAEMVANGAA